MQYTVYIVPPLQKLRLNETIRGVLVLVQGKVSQWVSRRASRLRRSLLGVIVDGWIVRLIGRGKSSGWRTDEYIRYGVIVPWVWPPRLKLLTMVRQITLLLASIILYPIGCVMQAPHHTPDLHISRLD